MDRTLRDKAKALYCHGDRTAKEIAEKLDIPLNTVKSWQKRDEWAKAKKEADGHPKRYRAPQTKKVAPEYEKVAPQTEKGAKKVAPKGAPKGNLNGVGHGAPKGNRNGIKHGAYSSIAKWGILDDEEKDFIKEVAVDDTEAQLIYEVEIYTVRERRILHAIKQVKEEAGEDALKGTLVDSVTASEKRLAKNPKEKVGTIEMRSTKTSATNVILRLEKELSTVQSGKARAIQALADYRAELRENDANSIVEQISDMFADIREMANAKGQDTSE